MHVHFRDPGMTHKETFATGTIAAAYGGISCVFDMPNTKPPTTSVKALTDKMAHAEKTAHIDFGLYAGITDTNLADVDALASHANGFKAYLGSTTNSLLLTPQNIKKAIVAVDKTSKPILIHAEDEACLQQHALQPATLIDHLKSRPASCECAAIKQILDATRHMKTRVHICHLSSCDGLELLRNRPTSISCGVTPHLSLIHI